jgi:hypothetical protein
MSKQNHLIILSRLEPRVKVWPSTFPSEIVQEKLYLGGYMSAKNREVLEELRITHILNVSDNCDCPFVNERK